MTVSSYGELLDKMPIGEAHSEAVNRLTRKFAKLLDESVTVSIQNPRSSADSEPEPDIALYTRRLPGKARPVDVHLVVEVADSSLDLDRTVKLPLYAEVEDRELWIVNLVDQQIRARPGNHSSSTARMLTRRTSNAGRPFSRLNSRRSFWRSTKSGRARGSSIPSRNLPAERPS